MNTSEKIIELHPTYYQGQTTFKEIKPKDQHILHKTLKKPRSAFNKEKYQEPKTIQINEKKPYIDTREFSAYDKARTNEYSHFKELLNELLFLTIKEDPTIKMGRTRISDKDRLFAMIMTTYHKADLRKAVSMLKELKEQQWLKKAPSFKSLSNFFNEEKFSTILDDLIRISSLPFVNFEKTIAIDATGFSTSQFARWFNYKWGKQEGDERVWVKLHAATGCNTNCFLSGTVTHCRVADIKMAKDIMGKVSKKFKVEDFVADKAYSSRELFQFIKDLGLNPYIPFKSNSKGGSKGVHIWKIMYEKFVYERQNYNNHYHKRSNVETNFSMIKERFGKNCKTKNLIAQTNEIKCKMLAVNITLLIQLSYKHNINIKIKTV